MKFYWLVLGILCVWRVAHLLSAEDGPWDLLVVLRRHAGSGFWGRLMDCFYCLSLWVAAPFALLLGEGWKEWLLLWPALSGAAILLQRATAKPESGSPTSTFYVEDEEKENVLREGETAADKTDANRWQPDTSRG